MVRAFLAAAGAAGSVGASLLRSRPRAGAEAPEKEKIEFFNSSLSLAGKPESERTGRRLLLLVLPLGQEQAWGW